MPSRRPATISPDDPCIEAEERFLEVISSLAETFDLLPDHLREMARTIRESHPLYREIHGEDSWSEAVAEEHAMIGVAVDWIESTLASLDAAPDWNAKRAVWTNLASGLRQLAYDCFHPVYGTLTSFCTLVTQSLEEASRSGIGPYTASRLGAVSRGITPRETASRRRRVAGLILGV